MCDEGRDRICRVRPAQPAVGGRVVRLVERACDRPEAVWSVVNAADSLRKAGVLDVVHSGVAVRLAVVLRVH